MVIGVAVLSHEPRLEQVWIIGTVADGERFDLAATVLRHQCDNTTRIKPAAECGAEWSIAYHM
jgi:hypothetical protein